VPGESVSLGAAHVQFTGDFAAFMDGMRHVVKVAVETTTTINLALKTTDKQVERSNRNIIRSYAELNREVRRHLRGITSELVFLQLDIGHIANQIQRMAAISAAAMGGAAAASISFEDAFANVRKTVDASEAEFRQLEQEVRRMSTQTRTSANDLAVIMGVAGQLGIRGVENLTAFTRTIDQLTIATNLTGEQGAQDLARFMNIMQESVGNVDRLGASIVDLGNNFATTEAEILSMATRIAGAGKTVGLTTQEVLALATAMSSVGIRPEMGGSAISRVLIEMANAVEKGGARLREFARVANMSAREFADAFRSDPIQALQAFINGLERLDRQGENVFVILESVGASEIRVRDTLLRLFQASGLLTDAVRRSNRAWEENVALTEEVAKRNQTAASQLRIAINNLIENARVVGDQYNPAIKQAAEFVTALSQAFQKMTPEQQAAAAEFVALSTAILGGIAAALLATKAFITFGTGVILLTRAVAALLSPWGLATVAIVTAAVVIAAKWDEIVKMISESDLGRAAKDAWESFKAVWTSDELTLPEKIIETVKITVKTITGLLDSIIDLWLNMAIPLAERGAKILGLNPDTAWLPSFLKKLDEIWENEELSFSERVIESIKITVMSVSGLIDSIRSWWLGQTIELARKTVKFLGLDPDENALVQFLERIKKWWDEHDVTLDEKDVDAAIDWSKKTIDEAKQRLAEIGQEFARTWLESAKTGRWFDPFTVIVESATEGIAGIRAALAPLRLFMRAWAEGVWGEIGLLEAFNRGLEGELGDAGQKAFASIFDDAARKGLNYVRSLLDFGVAIGNLIMEGIFLAFDLVDLINQAIIGATGKLLGPLFETGAEWAGAMVDGFRRVWNELADWFRNTWLGKVLINLGVIDAPPTDALEGVGATVTPPVPSIPVVQRPQGLLTREESLRLVEEAIRGSQTVREQIDDATLDLLARLAQAEAGVDGFEGMLAVAAVVLNRVASEEFPNSIRDVIYQTNQFEAVLRGTIDEMEASAEALRAVREALAGADPTGGALYFRNPDIATSSWFELRVQSGELIPVKRIGGHEFYVPGYREGVILPGFGGGDRIPALLEPGEAVVPARVVRGGIGDIVAWFRAMGVRKMQAGGIAGISTLAEAEAQIGVVSQEMTQFANTLLTGIEQITQSMSAFIFGAAQMIVDVLKALFPDHAETLQKGLDDLKAWWEKNFGPQPSQGPSARLLVPVTPPMPTPPVPKERPNLLKELIDQFLDLYQAVGGNVKLFTELSTRLEATNPLLAGFARALSSGFAAEKGGFGKAFSQSLMGFAIGSFAGLIVDLFAPSTEAIREAAELQRELARAARLGTEEDVLGLSQQFDFLRNEQANRTLLADLMRERSAVQAAIREAQNPATFLGIPLDRFGLNAQARAAFIAAQETRLADLNESIAELEKAISAAAPAALADALGIAADNFASALQSAFDSVSFSEFEKNFESSVNEIIRQGMVREFIANVIGPQIEDLAEKVQQSILSGSRPEMEQIREVVSGITEDSKPFFDLLEEMGLLAETTERVNSALRNVPAGFKIALTRFTVATPAPVPTFHDGGVMPYDGIANLRRGEVILTPEQARFGMGGIVVHVNVQGNVYGEVDLERIATRAVGNALRQRSMAAYGVT